MTQFELDLDVEEVEIVENPNPMVRVHGLSKEQNARCKTCKYMFRKRYAGTYYKCSLLGNTNGAGTDIRLKWDACRHYVESEETKVVRRRKRKNKAYHDTKSLVNSLKR